jgi:hypothetical protein
MAKWVRQIKAQIDPGTITIGNVRLTDTVTGDFATISDGNLFVKLDKPVTVDVALSETNDSVTIYGMSDGSFKAIATDSDGNTLIRVLSSAHPSDATSYTEQLVQTSELRLINSFLSETNILVSDNATYAEQRVQSAYLSDLLLNNSDLATYTEQAIQTSELRLIDGSISETNTLLGVTNSDLILINNLISETNNLVSDNATLTEQHIQSTYLSDLLLNNSDLATYTEQVIQSVYLSDIYQQISEIKLDTQYLSDAYNFSALSFDTTETSPALLQTLEATLMNAKAAAGSEASVNIIAYNKSTYHIIASDISDGGVISIESSLNNANWYVETTLSITSDGSNLYSIDGKRKYIRPNLTVCSDGKYTVLLLAGN